jgi:hypothetical protein
LFLFERLEPILRLLNLQLERFYINEKYFYSKTRHAIRCVVTQSRRIVILCKLLNITSVFGWRKSPKIATITLAPDLTTYMLTNIDNTTRPCSRALVLSYPVLWPVLFSQPMSFQAGTIPPDYQGV